MLGKLIWKAAKNTPRMVAVGVGAGITWSAVAVNHHLPLDPALPGRRTFDDDGTGRRMAVYQDESGTGDPVVLVHSVNVAASAYEMRPLYTRLQGERPVWALDLPGYGSSERGDRPFTPETMAAAVERLVALAGRPVHLVGLSLGAEFAARVAVRSPEMVKSLALISPTGFGRRSGPLSQETMGLLRFPLWSQAIYDGIVSRRSIRYLLGKRFAGPVDELMVDYAYATSHQPGARFAPFAFLSGRLSTSNAVGGLYARLEVSTTVIYDTDAYAGFSRLPEFLAGRRGWSATRVAGTHGLPHWDETTETVNALLAHWS